MVAAPAATRPASRVSHRDRLPKARPSPPPAGMALSRGVIVSASSADDAPRRRSGLARVLLDLGDDAVVLVEELLRRVRPPTEVLVDVQQLLGRRRERVLRVVGPLDP